MNEIVCGIDGSDASKEALRWAVEEGRLRRAPVLAVHTWLPPLPPADPFFEPVPPVDFAAEIRQFEEAAEALAGRMVEEVAHEGVDLRPVTIEGAPAPTLIEAAHDAQLLVVGARGRGGFLKLLIGSVSSQVASHASCPVLVHRRVPHEER
jgi:nucleotide-binding universal stress UspA family protein